MLTDLWLLPPLAFARVGASDEPSDAFDWGPNDLTPHGTGRTTVRPAPTLQVGANGEVSLKKDGPLTFKDKDGKVKPVCPFFELHGVWDGGCGPITPDVLKANGLSDGDLQWQVTFCNYKAFHWTRSPGDKIVAVVEIAGGETEPRVLCGRAPDDLEAGVKPLVPTGACVPLGSVQLTKPNGAFPGFRLRFAPGKGVAYGPRNLADRIGKLDPTNPILLQIPLVRDLYKLNERWLKFTLPPERSILDPDASWPTFELFSLEELQARFLAILPHYGDVAARTQNEMLAELLRFVAGPQKDVRNLPPGLYAWVVEPPNHVMISLGLVDDLGDGVVECTIEKYGRKLVAQSRVVTGPPAWAPDRRPVVSLADGLADRMDRDAVRDPAYVARDPHATEAEIRDLLDRAFETVGLANLDAMNDYFAWENFAHGMRPGAEYDPKQAKQRVWHGSALRLPLDLPLTAIGRDRHRRNTVDMFFDPYVVDTDHFMQKYVRVPAGAERLYDQKMPGLMRGGDRRPLTLTRRQYDLLAAWVAELRKQARKT